MYTMQLSIHVRNIPLFLVRSTALRALAVQCYMHIHTHMYYTQSQLLNTLYLICKLLGSAS
jgi:hypothetical protein